MARAKPSITLNKKTVARLKAPDPSGKPVIHWDAELRGFGVLCSGISNSRTYVVQRDTNGKARRVTVGKVNEIDLDEARKRAADMLDDLRRGLDPKLKQVAALSQSITLRQSLDDYLAARNDLRSSSAKLYRHAVEKHLTKWLDLPLREINADMIQCRHREIDKEVGPTTANFAIKVFGFLWGFVAGRVVEEQSKPGSQSERVTDMPPNPVHRLNREKQWFPEKKRTRTLRAEDIPTFWTALQALNPVARDFVTLLLFTGMRRTEASSMTWTDIDFVDRVIRVPAERTKPGRDLVLPMSDVIHSMLVARRALGRDVYVFPGVGGDHLSPSRPLHLLKEATGIEISAHDLRRTYATVAESVEISHLALKSLLNHSTRSDITAAYVQMSIERLREPVQRVADKLKKLCEIPEVTGENVAAISRP